MERDQNGVDANKARLEIINPDLLTLRNPKTMSNQSRQSPRDPLISLLSQASLFYTSPPSNSPELSPNTSSSSPLTFPSTQSSPRPAPKDSIENLKKYRAKHKRLNQSLDAMMVSAIIVGMHDLPPHENTSPKTESSEALLMPREEIVKTPENDEDHGLFCCL